MKLTDIQSTVFTMTACIAIGVGAVWYSGAHPGLAVAIVLVYVLFGLELVLDKLERRTLIRDRLIGFFNPTDLCPVDKRMHDYHHSRGGSGYPDHFADIKCWKCGQTFRI